MEEMTFEQFAHELEVARKNKMKDPNPQPLRDQVGVIGFIGGVTTTIAGLMSTIVEVTSSSLGLAAVGAVLMVASMILVRH